MDIYRVRGSITKVWDTQTVSDKFRKREFVIEYKDTNERGTFIDYLKLQMVQSNCDLLDGINKGDLVIVQWKPTGRRWKNQDGEWAYFTNLEATDIDVVSRADGTGSEDTIDDQLPLGQDDPFASSEEPQRTTQDPIDDIPDDLPF